MTSNIDVIANRSSKKWSSRELFKRFLWEYIGAPIFSLVPRPLWWVRCVILRIFGAQIGQSVHIYPSVKIKIPDNLIIGDYVAIGDRSIIYNLGVVSIGNAATISQGTHICAGTHDYKDLSFPLLKQPIEIGAGCWICADAFIGPAVTVGESAIIGARAVVTKDVAASMIVVGNPAHIVGKR